MNELKKRFPSAFEVVSEILVIALGWAWFFLICFIGLETEHPKTTQKVFTPSQIYKIEDRVKYFRENSVFIEEQILFGEEEQYPL